MRRRRHLGTDAIRGPTPRRDGNLHLRQRANLPVRAGKLRPDRVAIRRDGSSQDSVEALANLRRAARDGGERRIIVGRGPGGQPVHDRRLGAATSVPPLPERQRDAPGQFAVERSARARNPERQRVERHRVAAARHRLRDAAEEAGRLRSVRSAWCGRMQTNAPARSARRRGPLYRQIGRAHV